MVVMTRMAVWNLSPLGRLLVWMLALFVLVLVKLVCSGLFGYSWIGLVASLDLMMIAGEDALLFVR